MENRHDGNLKERLNPVCEHCGKIFDYEVRSLTDRREIAKETGFLVGGTGPGCYEYCMNCHAKTEGRWVQACQKREYLTIQYPSLNFAKVSFISCQIDGQRNAIHNSAVQQFMYQKEVTS